MSGSRRKPGPLGPFVDRYRARLLELGYSPLSVRHSLTALGHLGRWMDREELKVEQLNDDVLEAFLADHVAEHGHLPSAGVMPLLEYLRGEGVVPPEPARRLTLIDRFLDEYRDWLAVSRGRRNSRRVATHLPPHLRKHPHRPGSHRRVRVRPARTRHHQDDLGHLRSPLPPAGARRDSQTRVERRLRTYAPSRATGRRGQMNALLTPRARPARTSGSV